MSLLTYELSTFFNVLACRFVMYANHGSLSYQSFKELLLSMLVFSHSKTSCFIDLQDIYVLGIKVFLCILLY